MFFEKAAIGVGGKCSKDLIFLWDFSSFCSIGFARCLMLLFLEFLSEVGQ